MSGPLTEKFFEAHTEELQIAEKPDPIAWVLESHKNTPFPLPRELAERVTPTKRKGKR